MDDAEKSFYSLTPNVEKVYLGRKVIMCLGVPMISLYYEFSWKLVFDRKWVTGNSSPHFVVQWVWVAYCTSYEEYMTMLYYGVERFLLE